MHDIWNPWHGCRKIAAGCRNCYMYTLDRRRGMDGSVIFKTKNFDYPLQRERNGQFKIRPGELIRVCMTSDFFLEEADQWRAEAFALMAQRPDVKFYLLTKRADRMRSCLPDNYPPVFPNLIFNVSAENQQAADARIPYLLDLPCEHKGVMCAPLLGPVNLRPYLAAGQIEQVITGGENYDNPRPCDFAWVQDLSAQCAAAGVKFTFIETGSIFIKDGKQYSIPNKRMQSYYAAKARVNVEGLEPEFALTDSLGLPFAPQDLYQRSFGPQCKLCGSRPICNGCAHCSSCSMVMPAPTTYET